MECGKISSHIYECVFGIAGLDAGLLRILRCKSIVTVTFLFVTEVDVIDIGVERDDLKVST